MIKLCKKLVFLVVTAIFCFSLAGIATAKTPLENVKNVNDANNYITDKYVEGELFIRVKPENAGNPASIASLHSQIGASVIKEFKNLAGLQLVKLPEGLAVMAAVNKYKPNSNVLYAEPNYLYFVNVTPNDSSYNQLWGLNNTGQSVNGTAGTADADIDAPEAWDYITGSYDVIVAVVDSGVDYNHPELVNNIWTNPGEIAGNGTDDDGNGYIDDVHGWDFYQDDNDPMDVNSHGTHVSGTIAAVGNNSQGLTGVMWNARIMPLRFLGPTGSGDTEDAIDAITYANQMGANVINNSWGGGGYSQALRDTINASPAVVTCSAGNDGTDNDSTAQYPSSYDCSNIIAVAATNQNDSLASFSCRGATSVDVAAPGVGIYSSVPARKQVFFDNMTNMDNWNAQIPWALTTSKYYSSPSCATDSPDGNYGDNSETSLSLKNPINLTGEHGVKLEYKMCLETESGYDALFIDASQNGSDWENIYGWTGSTGGAFYSFEEDLTAYDGRPSVYVRFRLKSDSSAAYDGAYIDDIKVTSSSATYTGTEYAYFSGTSMATPHVSGLAGLTRAYRPNLTNLQIKQAILDNVDTISSLGGKVLTGGRINAQKTLSALAIAPYGAQITSDTIPTTMTAGQSYSVSVTVMNTGANTWTAAENYRLGAVGNTDPFAVARQYLSPAESIATNQSRTFTYTMTAPATAGSYTTDWRMLREYICWFGDTLTKTVTVN